MLEKPINHGGWGSIERKEDHTLRLGHTVGKWEEDGITGNSVSVEHLGKCKGDERKTQNF